MKVYKNLFKKICTEQNFYKAYKNAIKGKKHYREVLYINKVGPRKYLHNLLNEVKNKTYSVSKYTIFLRFTGGKLREIYKLPMRDRIVLHAIMNYLEPIFRETFILDTYSSIKTRGIHLGLSRVKKGLRKYNYKYCMKLDIHKCYPSLDLLILKDKLSKKFKDKDLLYLLYKIIDSCDKGVPIGNYTSQYFNNFYFNDFDHWMKEHNRIKCYFRYCDDMVVLSDNKQHLHDLLNKINIKIKQLHVKLKSNWQIFNIDCRGVDFLGYVIRREYTKIRKHIKYNFISKIRKMNLNNLSSKDVNVIGSYWGILKHGDCRNLWFKYTQMKKFRDLCVSVHEREFVKNILNIPIVIKRCTIIRKGSIEWIKLYCDYSIFGIDHKDVIISSKGDKLVEAGKQFDASCFPFETTIKKDINGYYEFT